MAELRNRDLRTDFDGGSGNMPDNLPPVGGVSRAQSEWTAGREALEFTISESLESYRAARAEKEYNAAVTFLEQCAVAALRLSDYTTQRVVADAEKLDRSNPLDIKLAIQVIDLVATLIPGLGEDAKPHNSEELAEKAEHIIQDTKPRRGEWYKLHKDYKE
jgi:hypothetical protein